MRPTCSMRCASPGNERKPFWICGGDSPSASAAPVGAGRVLRIVHAAQRSDAAEQREPVRGAAGGLHDPPGLDIDAVGERAAHRHAHHPLARALDAVGRGLAPVVVDADDGRAVLLHAGDQPLLHRRVVRQRAVTVEVVLADIDQDADRRIERRREVDLIGRHLDHVQRGPGRAARATGSRCRYCRRAGRRNRRRASRCAMSAVVVDLPLVPVMATNGAFGAWRRRSRQNSSMSPITSTAAARASPTDPVRRRMGQRHARARAPARRSSTSRSCRRSAVGMPALVALATVSALSSQPITSAPPASSALALTSPEPPRPNTATFLPAKLVTGIMATRRRRARDAQRRAVRMRGSGAVITPPSFRGHREATSPKSITTGGEWDARQGPIGPPRNDALKRWSQSWN